MSASSTASMAEKSVLLISRRSGFAQLLADAGGTRAVSRVGRHAVSSLGERAWTGLETSRLRRNGRSWRRSSTRGRRTRADPSPQERCRSGILTCSSVPRSRGTFRPVLYSPNLAVRRPADTPGLVPSRFFLQNDPRGPAGGAHGPGVRRDTNGRARGGRRLRVLRMGDGLPDAAASGHDALRLSPRLPDECDCLAAAPERRVRRADRGCLRAPGARRPARERGARRGSSGSVFFVYRLRISSALHDPPRVSRSRFPIVFAAGPLPPALAAVQILPALEFIGQLDRSLTASWVESP